jgi:hypothetical protein
MIQQCQFSFLCKKKSHVDSLACGVSEAGTKFLHNFIILRRLTFWGKKVEKRIARNASLRFSSTELEWVSERSSDRFSEASVSSIRIEALLIQNKQEWLRLS